MQRFFLLILTCLFIAGVAHAKDYTPTTQEAQAFVDASILSNNQYWSHALLAMAQLVVALATLSLLINMRTLCFIFLFCYGLLIINVPYYVPDKFKLFFGFAILVMSMIGVLWRLLGLRKGTPVAPTAKQ